MGGAPDYLGPVCGWRAWFLVEGGQGLRLRSVVYPTLWQPGRALQAECLSKGDHPAPVESCRCGIYAVDEPARAVGFADAYASGLDAARLPYHIVGRVFVWGTVVECEHGWRAARAYPAHLYLLRGAGRGSESSERAARRLAAYAVPIELLAGSREELLATLAPTAATAG